MFIKKLLSLKKLPFSIFISSKRLASIKLSVKSSNKTERNPLPLLVVPFTTFLLGTWQIYRKQWKEGLVQALNERTNVEAVPLPSDLDEIASMEYMPVKVIGKFDNSREIYILPRPPVDAEENAGSGLSSSSGNIGAYIITPFQLSDTNEFILVNRGWVPKNSVDPATRPGGQIDSEIELKGLLRQSEKGNMYTAENDKRSLRWNTRDVDAMAEALNTLPIFIDADKNSSVPGGPIGGQTKVKLRNEHLSYILTWYSLCSITSYMWYSKYGHYLRFFRK